MRSMVRWFLAGARRFGLPGGLALAFTVPAGLAAQMGAGVPAAKLELATSSEAAKTEFWAALDAYNNIEPSRGTPRIKRALELDPGFGLARVVYAQRAAGLTPSERTTEMARGVADAAKGSAVEALVAMGLRDFFTNRERSRTILEAAATLAPGDPNIAFFLGQLANNAGESATAMEDLIARFPDFAPAYNTLAYSRWTLGDQAGARTAVTTYMEKASAHPNTHDSYAEILQWSGQLDDALAHYQKALDIDPDFTEGGIGLAEVYVLQGKGAQARGAIMGVLGKTTVPATRVTYQRDIASTYLLENNVKQAIVQLGVAAAEAKKAGLGTAEANIHGTMAMLDGAFGDGKSVAAHGAAATQADAGFPHYAAAFGYGFARQADLARRELEAMNQAETPSVEVKKTLTAQVTAILALNDNKPAEALAALRQADAGPVTRALRAIALFKSGDLANARSLRDEILSNRQINLGANGDIIARQLVKRIN